MNLRVEHLSAQNDQEVMAFLDELGAKSPSVLGYHYPFYREMLVSIGAGTPLYLGAYLKGNLAGYLPAFIRQSPAGTVYSSLPFFGPNAGVLCVDCDERREIHTALLKALLGHACDSNALCCSVYTPFLFDELDLYDSAMPGALVVDKFTQYLDLQTAVISGHLRKNLRRARRDDLEISSEVTPERAESFYSVYEKNCTEFGIPVKPRACVESILSEAHGGQRATAYFALHQGEMIAGLLVIHSPLTVSYYIPCSLAGARKLQAGDLLIDRALEDARRRGARIWNWESSPSRESGVYQFKKKWGAVEATYRIYVKTLQPRERFEELRVEGIAREFPFYFVYPFNLIRRNTPMLGGAASRRTGASEDALI